MTYSQLITYALLGFGLGIGTAGLASAIGFFVAVVGVLLIVARFRAGYGQNQYTG